MTLRSPCGLALGLFLTFVSVAVAATGALPSSKKPAFPPQNNGKPQAGPVLLGTVQIETKKLPNKIAILTTRPGVASTDYYMDSGNAAQPVGALYSVATLKAPYYYTQTTRTVCHFKKEKDGTLTLHFCKEQYQVTENGKLGWLDKVDANNKGDALELTPALAYFTKKITDANQKDSFSFGRRALAKELLNDAAPQPDPTYQEALRDYAEAIYLGPTATLYNNRGCCRFKAAKQAGQNGGAPNYTNALQDFKTAYGMDPKMAEAYYNYGLCLDLQGKYLEAFAQYVAATVADNTDPVGFYGAARLLTNQAEQFGDKAIELARTYWDKAANLDTSYKLTCNPSNVQLMPGDGQDVLVELPNPPQEQLTLTIKCWQDDKSKPVDKEIIKGMGTIKIGVPKNILTITVANNAVPGTYTVEVTAGKAKGYFNLTVAKKEKK